ncbi:Csu type fimbrial protein [Psychrobacter sp. PL15]|uniref:Csu type fimbrial protein n=1 Tax=Psychrobacter sp. PL15 TaxID=3071719 RepID=UPI002E109BF3
MKLPNDILWGTRRGDGSEYNSGPIVMPRRPGFLGSQSSISGSVIINASLLSKNGNSLATSGSYIANFNGGHTALTFKAEEDLGSANCATGDQDDDRFSFTVQANVIDSCKINTTSDINLGSHPANETDILGNSNAINMTCTNEASYYIDLTPSNDNTNGAGVLKGSGSNTDKVPYQLRSTAGTGGKIWGNTATTTDVGNGVPGIGSGVFQTQTVYVTVPSADFKPDNYSDTVTIRVNY